ncbi:MAG: hypothetical protein AB7V48_15170 [Sedimentibacter sp.]
MKYLQIDMIKQIDEKKRALNIIWNASDDYSFQPDFKVFDENGKADLYRNFIIGAAYKYYDCKLLKAFFNYLKTDSAHEFYEHLFWIGLENSIYLKAKKDRPILKNLRRHYSKKVLRGDMPPIESAILNEIKIAHYKRVLGINPTAEERVIDILNELEFKENMNTGEIISSMNEIINKYFKFRAGSYEILLEDSKEKKKPSQFEASKEYSDEKEDAGYSLMKNLVIESAETTRDFYFEQDDELKMKNFNLHKFKGDRVKTDRTYIQKYYGLSMYQEHKVQKLEQLLCTDNHKKANLHFTRGELDQTLDADAMYNKKQANEQRESNLEYYYNDYSKNNNSIIRLTNKIRNTMLVNFESSIVRSKHGTIDARRIWRSIHVNDNKVFNKDLKNDIGNITVDILLDSSASQHERQEIIATQGYIIAESLTRCQIPVKVYSFCSLRGYTIFNLFRDYDEINKNDKVFNYRPSGSNRDGLAIRTAVHMMENTQSENKILIALSDCKPYDMEMNPGTGIIPLRTEYSGVKGVNDTAYEVKRGIMKGNSILCVFTGEDEDVPSAKRIYGHNFVRIHSLDKFADIVGILLQNQLKNL